MPSNEIHRSRPAESAAPPRLKGRRRPGLAARLRTFWKSPEIDQALAAGADPLQSEELLLRAQQLAEPRKRAAFARAIARVVDDAGLAGPQLVPGPRIVRRDPIKANRSLLLELAERLRSDGPHGLRGLAMVDLFVYYGDSPLYRAGSPLELEKKVVEVLTALDPTSR